MVPSRPPTTDAIVRARNPPGRIEETVDPGYFEISHAGVLMSSAAILMIAIKASVALTVFGVGLRARPADTSYLLRHRSLLARSMASMSVMMPILAVCLATAFRLAPPVKLALIALSISPVPPLLPSKIQRAGGEPAYAIGLLVAASALSILIIPLGAWMIGALLGAAVYVSPALILPLVAASVVVPLFVGLGVRRTWPALADRAAEPIALLATSVLIVALVPILLGALRPMISLIGNATVLVMLLVSGLALAIGHALGGPRPEDRTVLALATATRHPGIAIAIAGAAFPGQAQSSAAVLLATLVAFAASAPYTAWVKRRALGRSPLAVTVRQQPRRGGRAPEPEMRAGFYGRRRDDI